MSGFIGSNPVKDFTIAITGADFFHLQQWVWQVFRCAEAKGKGGVDVRWGNQLHPLQHFDTTLRLLRLAGFGLKVVDKALQVLDF